MKIKTVVSQSSGMISVTLQPQFIGDANDTQDKQKIAAFGDPEVNIAGTFTDPNDPTFTFQFPTTEMYVGVTTELSAYTAKFMVALPSSSNPNVAAPIQGALDCVTTDPGRAAGLWADIICNSTDGRVKQAMTALRNKTVPTIPSEYTAI